MERQIRDYLHTLVVLSGCQLAAVSVWVGYSILSHEQEKAEGRDMVRAYMRHLDSVGQAMSGELPRYGVKRPK